MTELKEILKITGHGTPFEDSKKALEQIGATIHQTDDELAHETFSTLEQHGVQQTGNAVLPNLTPSQNLTAIAQQTEIITQRPISTEEASGWNRTLSNFISEKILRRRQNAA